MGTSSKDGRLTIYLSERFYYEHKEVLNRLIEKYGETTPFMMDESDLYPDVITYLSSFPGGGYITTSNKPLMAYLRIHGVDVPKGESIYGL